MGKNNDSNNKLNLLKPEYYEGNFKDPGRKREKYRYLHVSEKIEELDLKDDIKAGAVMFKPCLEYLQGTPSRFIAIDCANLEEGLKAVTYISAVLEDHEDYPDDPFSLEVREEAGETVDEEAWYSMDESGDVSECEWYDEDCNIPIVSANEIEAFENDSELTPFGGGFNGFQRQGMPDKKEPYWTDMTHGEIIITDNVGVGPGGEILMRYPGFCRTNWEQMLRRFSRNRRVYLLLVRELENLQPDEDDEDMPFGDVNITEERSYMLSRILLDNMGVHISLNALKAEKEKYELKLFKNWLNRFELRCEKNFPVKSIASKICKLDKSMPSTSMYKVLKYIVSREPMVSIITRNDFEKLGVVSTALSDKPDVNTTKVREEDLVGMDEVKRQFEQILYTMKFTGIRRKHGLRCFDNHNVFLLLGAPGTAKTTMAQIMGRRMKEEKLLGGTRFGAFSGAQLKAQYLGQTAHRVHTIFEKHDIILIDEAYSIASGNHGEIDSYGQEALAQLAIELEEHGNDRLVFFAGYGGCDVEKHNNMMKDFLDANPGIKSRINATIVFPSYDADQMLKIVCGIASNYGYKIEEKGNKLIRDYFAQRTLDDNFGNGREARSFVENCQMILAERLLKNGEDNLSKSHMQLITAADVELTIRKLRSADTEQLGQAARTIGFK